MSASEIGITVALTILVGNTSSQTLKPFLGFAC